MVSHHTKTAKKHHTKSAHKRRGHASKKMRGGVCMGASGYGTAAFGSTASQMAQLDNSSPASTLLVAHPPAGMVGGMLVARPPAGMVGGKRHKKGGKKHGGSALAEIAVPIVLVAANQMYRPKASRKHKAMSFRRRRSMRGGEVADVSAELDTSMATGAKVFAIEAAPV